jgi:hypothetical protein
MMVDLVNVTTRDGIRLDGAWRKPAVLIMVGAAEAQTMMAFQGLPPSLEKGVLANDFIFGGILDRFPHLKVVCSEFELSWIPPDTRLSWADR